MFYEKPLDDSEPGFSTCVGSMLFLLRSQANKVPKVFGGSRAWAREWLLGGTRNSFRQTSVTEAVTDWLSCQREERGSILPA